MCIRDRDGDDYWTCKYKLERQLAILQQTKSVLSFHSCHVLVEETEITSPSTILSKTSFSDPMDLSPFTGNIPTASVVFDKSVIPDIPTEYFSLSHQDTPLWLLLAARGEVCYIAEVWSVYRIHSAGIWSLIPDIQQSEKLAKLYKTIAIVLGKEPDRRAKIWEKFFERAAKANIHQTILNRVQSGMWKSARKDVIEYILCKPRACFLPPKGYWSLYLRILLGIPSSFMKCHTQTQTMAGSGRE